MTARYHPEIATATCTMQAFGSSAPLEDMPKKVGFTEEKCSKRWVELQLAKARNVQT